MKTLDDLIKEFNLLYTDTLKRDSFHKVGFDSRKELVNFKNCISLYQLISDFNNTYNAFIKEYKDLNKLDLGDYIEIIGFRKYDNDRQLYIWAPDIIDKGDSIIRMIEIDKKIVTICTNDINPYNKNYYKVNLEYDENKVKKYLDLFERYQILLNQYNYLKNQMIFGDGCTTMFSKIEGNLLQELKSFEIFLGNDYFNTGDYIIIPVNLGQDININYEKVNLGINTINEKVKQEDSEKILKKVYINKKYLDKKVY